MSHSPRCLSCCLFEHVCHLVRIVYASSRLVHVVSTTIHGSFLSIFLSLLFTCFLLVSSSSLFCIHLHIAMNLIVACLCQWCALLLCPYSSVSMFPVLPLFLSCRLAYSYYYHIAPYICCMGVKPSAHVQHVPVHEECGSCIAGDQWSPVKIRVNTKPAGLAGHKAHTTTVPIHVDARASSLQCFQVHNSPLTPQSPTPGSQEATALSFSGVGKTTGRAALAAVAGTDPLLAQLPITAPEYAEGLLV